MRHRACVYRRFSLRFRESAGSTISSITMAHARTVSDLHYRAAPYPSILTQKRSPIMKLKIFLLAAIAAPSLSFAQEYGPQVFGSGPVTPGQNTSEGSTAATNNAANPAASENPAPSPTASPVVSPTASPLPSPTASPALNQSPTSQPEQNLLDRPQPTGANSRANQPDQPTQPARLQAPAQAPAASGASGR